MRAPLENRPPIQAGASAPAQCAPPPGGLMRTATTAAVAALTAAALGLGPAAAAASSPDRVTTTPVPCANLTALTLPNTSITSAAVAPADATNPATCKVHATVTHPPAGDTVNIDVW